MTPPTRTSRTSWTKSPDSQDESSDDREYDLEQAGAVLVAALGELVAAADAYRASKLKAAVCDLAAPYSAADRPPVIQESANGLVLAQVAFDDYLISLQTQAGFFGHDVRQPGFAGLLDTLGKLAAVRAYVGPTALDSLHEY